MLLLTEGSECCDALESVKKMRARRMEVSTAPEFRAIGGSSVADLL